MSETLKDKAYEIIESTINCLSEKAYDQLGDIVSVDDSWADGELNAIQGFTEWLDGQLQMWSDDYGKEIIIDAYDATQVVEDSFNNGIAIFEYNPTSNGETMDFWFEIRFEAEGDVIKTAVFNVNM